VRATTLSRRPSSTPAKAHNPLATMTLAVSPTTWESQYDSLEEFWSTMMNTSAMKGASQTPGAVRNRVV
ncbi:hypothetical protein ACO2WH_28845, partial [Escherichia coli]|uniref:hypothetical protein n=1 Tax=Escherichia coli TaxID=562 RepID=UPI003C0399C0